MLRAFFLLILVLPLGLLAQGQERLSLRPYFAAVIVSDMDSSLSWYSRVLGYNLHDQKAFEQMGFRQANLRRDSHSLELIELQTALSPEETIPEFDARTRLHGLFKIGFQVSDFDQWLDHLEKKKVNQHGQVVNDPVSGKRMLIILDPDGNRIQLFEE